MGAIRAVVLVVGIIVLAPHGIVGAAIASLLSLVVTVPMWLYSLCSGATRGHCTPSPSPPVACRSPSPPAGPHGPSPTCPGRHGCASLAGSAAGAVAWVLAVVLLDRRLADELVPLLRRLHARVTADRLMCPTEPERHGAGRDGDRRHVQQRRRCRWLPRRPGRPRARRVRGRRRQWVLRWDDASSSPPAGGGATGGEPAQRRLRGGRQPRRPPQPHPGDDLLVLNPDTRVGAGAVDALRSALTVHGTGIAVPACSTLTGRRRSASAGARRCCARSARRCSVASGPGRVGALGEIVVDPAMYTAPCEVVLGERCGDARRPPLPRRAGRLGRVVLPLRRGDRAVPAGGRPGLAHALRARRRRRALRGAR